MSAIQDPESKPSRRLPLVIATILLVSAIAVVLRERHMILLSIGSKDQRVSALREGLAEGRRVAAILRLALSDPALEVRLAAMSALNDRDRLDRKVLPAPNSRAREAIIRLLGEQLESADETEREGAAEALRRIGLGKQRSEIVPRLIAGLVAEFERRPFLLRESAALMLLSDQGPSAGEDLLATSIQTSERGAFAIGVGLVVGWPRSLVERCSAALDSDQPGEEMAAMSYFLKWTGTTRTPLLNLPQPHLGRLIRCVDRNRGSSSTIKRQVAEQLARMLNRPAGGGE